MEDLKMQTTQFQKSGKTYDGDLTQRIGNSSRQSIFTPGQFTED